MKRIPSRPTASASSQPPGRKPSHPAPPSRLSCFAAYPPPLQWVCPRTRCTRSGRRRWGNSPPCSGSTSNPLRPPTRSSGSSPVNLPLASSTRRVAAMVLEFDPQGWRPGAWGRRLGADGGGVPAAAQAAGPQVPGPGSHLLSPPRDATGNLTTEVGESLAAAIPKGLGDVPKEH